MDSQLRTVREKPSPEATNTGGRHTVTLGVKAWGPFRDGRFLVNVGHAEYTPAQAIRLAVEIMECASAAAQAQREAGEEPTGKLKKQGGWELHTWDMEGGKFALTCHGCREDIFTDENYSELGDILLAVAEHECADAPQE